MHGLIDAQSALSDRGLTLILTRGYESRGTFIRVMHQLARIIGSTLFCLVYPHRAREAHSIFSPNGHDQSGDCVDVGVLYNDDVLRLLPLGVFTPLWLIKSIARTHQRELSMVADALQKAGFTIHGNATEALQIHCEMHE